MPKIIAHALTGATIVTAIHPTAGINNWIPVLIGAMLAISADLILVLIGLLIYLASIVVLPIL